MTEGAAISIYSVIHEFLKLCELLGMLATVHLCIVETHPVIDMKLAILD